MYVHPDDYKIKSIANNKVKDYSIETDTLKATRENGILFWKLIWPTLFKWLRITFA